MFVVLALHAVLGVALIVVGDRLGRRAFALAAIAPVVALTWLALAADHTAPPTEHVAWVPSLGLTLDLRADALSTVMVLLVSGIGLLVCVYALGYFSHPVPGTARLAGVMTIFAGSMLGVVLSDHLLALFLFWELTSVTSYLLIGNDDRDRAARDAALSAVLITGAGGLAMLAGFVIIGQAAGTYRLSELATVVPDGRLVDVALVLVLVGAFTKSAQTPFGSWLPGAMVAPTPVSTYLHAATMVKAGVYLVARLSPIFAEAGAWRTLTVVVGAVTMLHGGWRAMRQHDLKLLLAYGTVSQLGFLMVLFGSGLYPAAQAGVLLLLAHGAFKASLFMVVGIVDHQVGTRDVRRLHGFGRGWMPVVAAAVLAAASMAGVPPLVGFISKEKALQAALDAEPAGAGLALAAVVVGSVLTFAYSGRFVLGLVGRLGEPGHAPVTPVAPPPSPAFAGPALLLAALSLVAGLTPVIVDGLVRDATVALHPASDPAHVHLWAGLNAALGLSALVIATGVALVMGHARVGAWQATAGRAWRRVPSLDRLFWLSVDGVLRVAKRTAAIVQSGSLPVYLMITFGVAALAPLWPAIAGLDTWPDAIDNWMHVPIGALIVAAAIGATISRRRIAAALMLGAVGYGMAAMYVVHGAPDLALTQFAIETLATALFVLVLRFLPRRFVDRRPAVTAPIRVAVSAAVAVFVFVLAIAAAGTRSDVAAPSVSEEMVARAVPDGKGSNVVNVILVDFRGIDTLGEITVLAVAALGVVALSRTARRQPAATGLPAEPVVPEAGLDRLPVLDAASRVLFASIVVLSIYFLVAGHNQPGGGFVGGLTAGAAISLRYVAGGKAAVRATFRLRPWVILGGGLLLSASTATIPLLLGGSVLDHATFERDLPVLGLVKTTSALPFDIGVYFVVVGLVLMAYEAFGGDVAEMERRGAADRAAPAPIVVAE